ncbi:sunset domain-containing protein [Kribbella sp. NPDC055071]
MSWLFRNNWPWSLLAFFVGAVITWILLERRTPPLAADPEPEQEKEEVLVGATTVADPAEPAVQAKPEKPAAKPFSELMEPDPTLFDDIEPADAPKPPQPLQSREYAETPPGRFGAGSADAVPHQAAPDGFTIKGNAQSMLFHTPDSPYYGRTKPEVWFRTEADAERAGFTKYTRRPRKSTDPRN